MRSSGFTLDDLEVRAPDPDKLLSFLAEMEFRTLTKRIADALGQDAPVIEDKAPAAPDAPVVEDVPFDVAGYEQVGDAAALQGWIDRIYEVGYVAVDTETTGLDELRADLVGISLAVEPGKACYIPLIHKANRGDDLFGGDDLMKFDAKVFAQVGITLAPFDDTMLMSGALHAGLHGHGMDTLSERYLGHTPLPIKPLLGSGKSAVTFDKVPLADAVPYAAEDADITLRLWQAFKPQLHRTRPEDGGAGGGGA